jgi:flagellar hook-associated protein 1 FlgK
MPGFGSSLSIASSALRAQQAAIQVTGQNITNAQTPGYSKQVIELDPSYPERTPYGIFGSGVSITNVIRTRDTLLDGQLRDQSAPAAGFSARSNVLGQVDAIFGEPSSNGLASQLDAFWNAWSDLSANPANSSAKTVVQQAGTTLAGTLNRYSSQLADLAASTRTSIADDVAQVNALARQIAAINPQIVAAESGGPVANDLRDTRDKLIDQMSALVGVKVIDRVDGGDQVMIGTMPIVDGPSSKTLTISAGIPATIGFSGDPDQLRNPGGKIGASLDLINTDIGSATAGLDALAAALITDVNAIHQTGWSPVTAATGVDFFDSAPANATAQNIRLSAAVTANANAIASGNVANATGNNATALALAGLRDYSPSAASNSFGAAYQTLVSTVAAGKKSADDSSTVFQTLVQQADQRRKSADGVNTDEELIALMSHQQAYVAASKLIKTLDEMSQTLLSIKQ